MQPVTGVFERESANPVTSNFASINDSNNGSYSAYFRRAPAVTDVVVRRARRVGAVSLTRRHGGAEESAEFFRSA